MHRIWRLLRTKAAAPLKSPDPCRLFMPWTRPRERRPSWRKRSGSGILFPQKTASSFARPMRGRKGGTNTVMKTAPLTAIRGPEKKASGSSVQIRGQAGSCGRRRAAVPRITRPAFCRTWRSKDRRPAFCRRGPMWTSWPRRRESASIPLTCQVSWSM